MVAEALCALEADEEARMALARAGRRRVRERYAHRDFVDALEERLERAAGAFAA